MSVILLIFISVTRLSGTHLPSKRFRNWAVIISNCFSMLECSRNVLYSRHSANRALDDDMFDSSAFSYWRTSCEHSPRQCFYYCEALKKHQIAVCYKQFSHWSRYWKSSYDAFFSKWRTLYTLNQHFQNSSCLWHLSCHNWRSTNPARYSSLTFCR